MESEGRTMQAEAENAEEGGGTRGRITANTGNGRRIQLRQGVNIKAALQRNEQFGKSWRGSMEGG